MKNVIRILFAIIAVAVLAFGPAVQARNPLPPDTVFQGVKNDVPTAAILGVEGKINVANAASIPGIVRKIYLGTPAAAAANTIVTSVNMKTTAYTLAGAVNGVLTLDVPRNITVTQTAVGTADVGVPFIVVGTDIAGNAITESITSTSSNIVLGTKAFKTISSITSPAWVATSTADTVTVGVGNLLGLPVVLSASTGTALATLGTTVGVYATTGASTGNTLALSTIDASGAIYDGSKKLYVYLDR